ncbi:MAG: hypothetical protein ACP5MH_06115 [Thermoproteus sp.]
MRQIKRFFVSLLPFLVFLISVASPSGEYVFKAAQPALLPQPSPPPYAAFRNGTFYLYSSPFGTWRYPGLIPIDVESPLVYVNSDCPFGLPTYLRGPGEYRLDVFVPPGYQGTCRVEFLYASWKASYSFRVKEIDWYPNVNTRVAVVINGSGWQLLQLAPDGTLYAWNVAVGQLPLAGCVVERGGSLLIVQPIPYAQLAPGVLVNGSPLWIPAEGGAPWYTFLLDLSGSATIYVYPAPCLAVEAPPAPAVDVPAIASSNDIGLIGAPRPTAYLLAKPKLSVAYTIEGPVATVVAANGSSIADTVYIYGFGTSVGMYSLLYYVDFTPTAYLTSDLVLFGSRPPAGRLGPFWVFPQNGTTYYYLGPMAPYTRNAPLPFGAPSGWAGPFVVIADRTGRWGGLPQIVSVSVERLRPWS